MHVLCGLRSDNWLFQHMHPRVNKRWQAEADEERAVFIYVECRHCESFDTWQLNFHFILRIIRIIVVAHDDSRIIFHFSSPSFYNFHKVCHKSQFIRTAQHCWEIVFLCSQQKEEKKKKRWNIRPVRQWVIFSGENVHCYHCHINVYYCCQRVLSFGVLWNEHIVSEQKFFK